jgi:2-oxoisovalerate dehydrogenase E2 component (dihydrolipoyl transacylase)
MAKYSYNLPDIGEGVVEAEIVAWHVKVGDVVEEDAPIADMMTDKATVEMESPVSGIITKLAGEEGDIVNIGSMLVELEVDGDVTEDQDNGEDEAVAKADGSAVSNQAADKKAEPLTAAQTAPKKITPPADITVETAPPAAQSVKPDSDNGAKILASPVVRKRARELGINLDRVKPQADGRIRHADLDAYLSYGGGAAHGGRRDDEDIKVIGMRKRIAQNMAESKRNIPHFTYVEEINVTKLEAMRGEMNGNRGDRPKLTVLPLLITAICRTLRNYPMLNARYDDDAGIVTRSGAVHLGIATQTDAGLMVPVLRGAENMSVWDMAHEIARLSDAARSGKARSDELSGSTLTLTSLGPLGGITTTPVINRPEVAIIGPNKIVERPIVDNGQIAIAKMMNLSISCDHRVVDGYEAASFVQDLKRKIETPVFIFAD